MYLQGWPLALVQDLADQGVVAAGQLAQGFHQEVPEPPLRHQGAIVGDALVQDPQQGLLAMIPALAPAGLEAGQVQADQRLRLGGEQRQALPLPGIEPARTGVDQAQGADDMAVERAQRMAGIEADALDLIH